jgi:integrase
MKYVRQSGKRQNIPAILEVEQFQRLFGALKQRERTMVLFDCGTGLRRGELIGLRWGDVNFDKKQMNVVRSVVEMVLGDVKAEASKKAVPLDDFMLEELSAWHRFTPYKEPGDWVFASDSPRAGAKRGKQPYWPATIMRHFIQLVARKLGISDINWHTFRHTYSTLLRAKRGRSQGGARAAPARVHQSNDGRLHAGGNGRQTQGTVEGDRDDCAEKAVSRTAPA